jgi:AcrR family transcriptional regulator
VTTEQVVDGRRARGDVTRQKVARQAAMIATTHGLDSITVGTLAAATGVSKSGILTVFPNREAIQVAAVDAAREIYREAVLSQVYAEVPGKDRLRRLVDSWSGSLRDGVFPGGCFITATSVEFGRRDGAVAAAVRRLKQDWLDLLERELTAAGSPDPARDAFVIDAYLTAANTRRELFGDDSQLALAGEMAHELIDRL